MRVIILYRPNSDHSRAIEDYIADFQRFHPGAKLESHNIDSIDGSRVAETYQIMQYPAILAVADDGQVQQQWQGADSLPLMNDLAYFANQ